MGDFMTTIVAKILNGNIQALSKLITRIENGDKSAVTILKELYSHGGKARVIGLTGSPGVGKSSIIGELIRVYLQRDRKIAVIAVDPTSEFTGGGVLGDRIRMPYKSENLYIRSFGARGHLGGLSQVCGSTITLLEAAGYDRIIIETVGAGQSEVEIRNFADTVVVITTPNQGDDIQALKAGILEIGDIFVVNKADLPDADQTVGDLIQMTHLLSGRTATYSCGVGEDSPNSDHEHESSNLKTKVPPVIKTSTRTSLGITDLVDSIEELLEDIEAYIPEQFRKMAARLSSDLVERWRMEHLDQFKETEIWKKVCTQAAMAKLDPWSASEILWKHLQS